jgi:hypothetical protein
VKRRVESGTAYTKVVRRVHAMRATLEKIGEVANKALLEEEEEEEDDNVIA